MKNREVKAMLLIKVKETSDDIIYKLYKEARIKDTDIIREIFEWDYKTSDEVVFRIYPFVVQRLKKFSQNFESNFSF